MSLLAPACEFLIDLAKAFLWLSLIMAFLAALTDIVVKIAPLFPRGAYPPVRGPAATDPVKFIDALKALVEALTKAPAWIAMFLAGVALLWIANQAYTGICQP